MVAQVAELLEELTTELTELAELFELDDGAILDTTLELATELFELDDVATELADVVATELLVATEHTAPVMVGFSAATPLVSP